MKVLKKEQKELVNEAHETAAMPEGADKDAKKKELLDEAAKLDNKMADVEKKVEVEGEMKVLKKEQKELVNEAHQTAAMPEGADKDAKKKELLDEAAKLDNKMAAVEGKVDAAKPAPVPATPAASNGSSDDAKATTQDKPTPDSSGGLKDEMKLLEDMKA